jgi:hypothetical protein
MANQQLETWLTKLAEYAPEDGAFTQAVIDNVGLIPLPPIPPPKPGTPAYAIDGQAVDIRYETLGYLQVAIEHRIAGEQIKLHDLRNAEGNTEEIARREALKATFWPSVAKWVEQQLA